MLKKELAKKEEEAEVVREKLAQATESLAAKLDALSAARKASQELHEKLIASQTAFEVRSSLTVPSLLVELTALQSTPTCEPSCIIVLLEKPLSGAVPVAM
jgi:hypothetical protein